MFTFLGFSPLLHADWDGSVDRAEKDIGSAKDAAQTEYDTLQNYQLLSMNLGLAYSAKYEAIKKGEFTTIAAAVAAISSVVVTGGVTAPTVVGILAAAASLEMAWEGTDDLLIRYNDATTGLINQIAVTKKAIDAYNTAFDSYISVIDKHMIKVFHSGSSAHGKEGRKKWAPNYDVSTFVCLGECGEVFSTPISPHYLWNPQRCSVIKVFVNGITGERKPFQCTYYYRYSCDKHSIHQFDLDYGYSENETSTPGIFIADLGQPQPGDSVTLNLVTSEPYYYVSLYVREPWNTSDTYQQYTSGDGTSTETSFSYTFPSGSMHTGDFVFRAVIYRWSDMSSYEETFTVTVDMTPNCSECTDADSNCPNASAH